MTTNAGAQEMSRRTIGFTDAGSMRPTAWRRSAVFSPPSSAIASMPSSSSTARRPDTILRIVDKFLIELEAQLEEKGVVLERDEDARAGSPSMATIRRWARDRWRG